LMKSEKIPGQGKMTDAEWINEKAKWIYDNSICLDSGPHKIRHPISVISSFNFIRQLLQEVRERGMDK